MSVSGRRLPVQVLVQVPVKCAGVLASDVVAAGIGRLERRRARGSRFGPRGGQPMTRRRPRTRRTRRGAANQIVSDDNRLAAIPRPNAAR